MRHLSSGLEVGGLEVLNYKHPKEPYVHTKETYKYSKETYKYSKETYKYSKESYTNNLSDIALWRTHI